MSTIELRGLTKRFADGTLAVDGLDLEVADGELVIFVGPSGCGKSTALRMIAGLEEISEGELRIDGERVNDLEPAERDIAMVFQNYALYPNLTVRENIGYPLRAARVAKAERARQVEEVARTLDLEALLDRRPGQLSGGQRQRVAMGRAIVRRPRAFLMDEPLSNLDAKLRVHMRTQVALLQQRLGVTTIYVTHDQTEAMTLGDRVVVLRGGVVQQIGTPTELYRRPVNRFVASFIGSPPMSFVPARLDGDAVELPFGRVALDPAVATAARGRDLEAGVRPERFEAARLARAGAPGELGLTRTPTVVEALGAEDLVHFEEEGGHPVVARVDPRARARVGAPLELVLRPAGLVLFDRATGELVDAEGDRAAGPVAA